MTIPIYDTSILPCISIPYSNTQGKSSRYLGYKAFTGSIESKLTIQTDIDSKVQALDNFWKVDCNHGLDPFIINLPVFGIDTNMDLLVMFKDDVNDSKGEILWNSTRSLKILGRIVYIINDDGDFILSDEGQFVLGDNGDYIALTSRLKTNKEIRYGNS